MNLYLMRHGLAADVGQHGVENDAERPLTPEGRRKTKLAGQALRKLEVSCDTVLASPLLRTMQTAEIVAHELGLQRRVQSCPALAPPGDLTGLLQAIGKMNPGPDNLLLVGHEPFLSSLIGRLIAGQRRASVTMKKGALCKLAVPALLDGQCATLEWLITAKQMAAMA